MKRLDDQTLDALADLICGDDGPLYRKGWELPLFFRRAGLRCPDHDGSTRKWWTLDRLREFNQSPQDIEKILLRLADPREYKGDAEAAKTALTELNKLLAIEGFEIELSGVNPRLIKRKPGLVKDAKKTFVPLEPPDFAVLTNDVSLGAILHERWIEAQKCVDADVHVAALVMMGSLLEGALLAVVHANPAESNRSNACPKDKNGKPKPFHEWTLSDLINVAHECGWIQRDVKDFSHSLRDYRNMVHPWHQRAMGMTPDKDTCAICWEVVRAAVNDLAEWQKRKRSSGL